MQKIQPETCQEIIRALADGMSRREIMRWYGVKPTELDALIEKEDDRQRKREQIELKRTNPGGLEIQRLMEASIRLHQRKRH